MQIPLTSKDKKFIGNSSDVFDIMQRILLRDNKIDQEKEHFWIIGTNLAGYILYIELVSLGSVRATIIEPMNVYRIAVMKNATSVIAVHNHPSNNLAPSPEDRDITDRLIQVGKILNIDLVDHLIINTENYLSFKDARLMAELEKSLKYVPTYQIIEKIRQEEKEIARAAIQAEQKQRKKSEQEKEKILLSAVNFLSGKHMNTEEIAHILEIRPEEVIRIQKKSDTT